MKTWGNEWNFKKVDFEKVESSTRKKCLHVWKWRRSSITSLSLGLSFCHSLRRLKGKWGVSYKIYHPSLINSSGLQLIVSKCFGVKKIILIPRNFLRTSWPEQPGWPRYIQTQDLISVGTSWSYLVNCHHFDSSHSEPFPFQAATNLTCICVSPGDTNQTFNPKKNAQGNNHFF